MCKIKNTQNSIPVITKSGFFASNQPITYMKKTFKSKSRKNIQYDMLDVNKKIVGHF